MAQGIALAVTGACGPEGESLLKLLGERGFPCRSLLPLDDDVQVGRKIEFADKWIPITSYREADLGDLDLALVCGAVPEEFLVRLREQGCTLVAPWDLLVEEGGEPLLAGVNLERASPQKGAAVAVPDSLGTLLARLLSPLHDELGLLGVNVTWVRAVNGDGQAAVEALASETAQLLNGKRPKPGQYPHPIAFNLLAPSARAREMAFSKLWQALWGDDRLVVSVDEIVAPLFFGDIVSLFFEVDVASGVAEIADLLGGLDGCLVEEREGARWLSAAESRDSAELRLGSLRQVDGEGRCFAFSVVLDMGRAGMALNQIKIAEYLVKNLFVGYS